MLYLPPRRSLSSHLGSASATKPNTKHAVYSRQKQRSATRPQSAQSGEASCTAAALR